MNTDTRILIPDAETRARMARQHNAAPSHYVARHSTDNPPVRREPLPQHVRTQVIPRVLRDAVVELPLVEPGMARVRVPLQRPASHGPSSPAVVEAVVQGPADAVQALLADDEDEDEGPVSEGLLVRILRALRRRP